MISEQDAKLFIRLTLKQYKMDHLEVSFCPKLGVGRKAWGLFWFRSKKIQLTPKVLHSYELFRHVFYHELAHALDDFERGGLVVNGRVNAHGKNFNKWCKRLGIKKGRFIPKQLMP